MAKLQLFVDKTRVFPLLKENVKNNVINFPFDKGSDKKYFRHHFYFLFCSHNMSDRFFPFCVTCDNSVNAHIFIN